MLVVRSPSPTRVISVFVNVWCVCVQVCAGQRMVLDVIFPHFPLGFETVSLTEPGAYHLLRLAAQKALGSSCLCSTGITAVHCRLWRFT